MATEEDQEQAPAPKSRGNTVTIVLAGAAVFVAVLAAQVAAPPINRMLYGDPGAVASAEAEPVDEAAATTELPVAELDLSKLEPPIYVPLDPPLIVSLTGEGSQEQALRSKVLEFPLKKGASLDHQLYEQGKLALRLEANNLG